MSSKQEELKKLTAEKKELAAKQAAIREELDKTKAERKEARTAQAAARKEVRERKSELRDLSAKVYTTFSSGDSDAINQLADDVMEAATALATTIRSFGEANETLDEL